VVSGQDIPRDRLSSCIQKRKPINPSENHAGFMGSILLRRHCIPEKFRPPETPSGPRRASEITDVNNFLYSRKEIELRKFSTGWWATPDTFDRCCAPTIWLGGKTGANKISGFESAERVLSREATL